MTVISHADLAFRDLGENGMSQIIGATHRWKTQLRKTKNDASKILDKWTKEKRDTPRAPQVGKRKHMQQPLTKMSHAHRDFFGFVPPSSFGSTQASTDKKCHNYIERGHLTRLCPRALNCLGKPTLVESSRTMLEDESTMKPRRH
jgi:hypothetical protein